MGRLDGKVALVTGGGAGIGAAIARRFHDEGASVWVNDLTEEAAAKVVAELGDPALALAADVSDSAAVAAMFERVAAAGPLDVLVNNAGISGAGPDEIEDSARIMMAQLAEITSGLPVTTHNDRTVFTTDDQWRRLLAVHLDGTFFCCREALRLMGPRLSGSIINMGLVMGTSGGAGPGYSAAKAGILGLT